LFLDPRTLEAAYLMLKQKITPAYQRPIQENCSAGAPESQRKIKSLLYHLCFNFYLSPLRSAVAKKSSDALSQFSASNECYPRSCTEPRASPMGFWSLLS